MSRETISQTKFTKYALLHIIHKGLSIAISKKVLYNTPHMSEVERIASIGAPIVFGGMVGITWNTLINNFLILAEPKQAVKKKQRLIRLINQTHIPLSREFKLVLPHFDIDEILEHISTSHLGDLHGALTLPYCRTHGIDGPLHNVGCLNVDQSQVTRQDEVQFINAQGQNMLNYGDHIACVHFLPFGSVYRKKEFVGETLLLGAVDLLRLVNRIHDVSPGEKPKYLFGFTSEEFGKTLKMFGAQPIKILDKEYPKSKDNGGFCFDVEELLRNKSKLQRYLQRWKVRTQKTGLDERRARITAINYLL